MTQEDFRERISRLQEKQGPVAAATTRRASSEEAGAGPGHAAVGAIWGALTSFLAVFLNDNYERLFPWEVGSPSAWALAGLAFLLVSLLVLGIMLVSGLIYALFGRFGSRRWKVISRFFVFLFPGIVLAKVVGAAL